MTLSPWQSAILREGELYRVGGAVRDKLLGVVTNHEDAEDVDYVVRGIPPDRFEAILGGFGRVEFVGKAFGVYKFKPMGAHATIDIAYPRKEVSTGPGHRDFEVESDWRMLVDVDLARRDFTINAIAESVGDGIVIDPCGGVKDIERRVLRMVFSGSFREDPLRILRGVRFATRFRLTIDGATRDEMTRSAPLIDTVSRERVQEEFTKLLTRCDRPSAGFALMYDIGVLRHVLPELDRTVGVTQNEYHPDDVFWHSVKSCDAAPKENLIVRWAALLHDVGKVDRRQVIETDDGGSKVVFYRHERESAGVAARVLRRLRYSNDVVRRVVRLVENHMFYYRAEWNRSTVRRFIQRVGEPHIKDLFELRRADCLSRNKTDELEALDELRARIANELREAKAFKITDLAVDGR
ncbi:MAG: HD domain-containing protein, partial [bacterium]